MTYLGKPRWIDSEEEDRPFPVMLRPTHEELETAESVQFPGTDEYREYSADFSLNTDYSDSTDDQVLVAQSDPLLDEPEWGTAKEAPAMKKDKGTIQMMLDTDP